MRRNHPIRSSALLLVTALLLCGCGSGAGGDAAAEESLSGKTFVYTGEPFLKIDDDLFKIAINEDRTFSYCESMCSSYLGFGTWKVEDGILILTDNEQSGYSIQNMFRIDGEDLVFMEEGSSNFIYVKVKDGERFVSTASTEG